MLGGSTYSTVIGTLDFEAPLLASSWAKFQSSGLHRCGNENSGLLGVLVRPFPLS